MQLVSSEALTLSPSSDIVRARTDIISAMNLCEQKSTFSKNMSVGQLHVENSE